MALTMDDVISSVFELTFGEKSLTSNTVKFALQVAACSAQQSLSGNGRIARVLARYVERELPDRETLYRILATDAKAMINSNHITAIMRKLYNNLATLTSLSRVGLTLLLNCSGVGTCMTSTT